MTEEERNQIHEKIRSEIDKTKENILDLKELTKPIAPENAIGRLSRMDAINNKSVNEAALRQAETRISALEHALQRINNKDFGICTKCGTEMQVGRLLFRPESNRCIKCARK